MMLTGMQNCTVRLKDNKEKKHGEECHQPPLSEAQHLSQTIPGIIDKVSPPQPLPASGCSKQLSGNIRLPPLKKNCAVAQRPGNTIQRERLPPIPLSAHPPVPERPANGLLRNKNPADQRSEKTNHTHLPPIRDQWPITQPQFKPCPPLTPHPTDSTGSIKSALRQKRTVQKRPENITRHVLLPSIKDDLQQTPTQFSPRPPLTPCPSGPTRFASSLIRHNKAVEQKPGKTTEDRQLPPITPSVQQKQIHFQPLSLQPIATYGLIKNALQMNSTMKQGPEKTTK